jgi:rod shape-determining protein MreD
MKVFWTAVALLAALLVQSALSLAAPASARVLDPFLLVLVYCALVGGEIHGMLAGAAAGWVQDVHFGGRILGLSGLSKVFIGFGVGIASTRFHLTEPAPRLLVMLLAVLLDALILSWLTAAFDVTAGRLSLLFLGLRAGVNAVLGVALFELMERQLGRRSLKG